MAELAKIKNRALLTAIARKRWQIPLRAGLLGGVAGGEPYVSASALKLFSASTRRSQGLWLSRLAATAGQRRGGPIQVVELGTCVGISGMYLLVGMSEASGGHLTTFEGHADSAELARHHMNALIGEHGLRNVSFDVRVGQFEQTVAPFFEGDTTKLDLVFIDGHHLEGPTLQYHRLAMARIAERGIVVHDDIAWSEGMIRAWQKIRAQEPYECEELLLGGRPSRGVLYIGSERRGPDARHHLDGTLERTLRRAFFALRGNAPPY